MSPSHALPAPTFTLRPHRDAPPRGATPPGSGGAVEPLVRWGALLAAVALTAFLALRHFGRLDLDAMTLLPAAALLGAAAMSLGTALACLRALRDA